MESDKKSKKAIEPIAPPEEDPSAPEDPTPSPPHEQKLTDLVLVEIPKGKKIWGETIKDGVKTAKISLGNKQFLEQSWGVTLKEISP